MREEARNLHDAAQRLIAAENGDAKRNQSAKEPFRSESAAPFAATDWPPQPTESSAASGPALADADADAAAKPTRARSGGSACSRTRPDAVGGSGLIADEAGAGSYLRCDGESAELSADPASAAPSESAPRSQPLSCPAHPPP